MDDSFYIPINYQGNELEFEARLVQTGYLHKIEVLVNDLLISFEPDEERHYRALISPGHLEKEGKKINIDLLKAIASQLESLLTS
ncbi:hypothetical protein ADIARSV_0888 [Arcticibacter svalbardensis MN12-7]|uniref:Uncharacterized protein n=1 Tax=Arcticibacter svalbardensis MN12-7 TaxID=1150600 RepID=R9GW84_9SPHI|nr:hypothetical protein [Arcticibacter svalbardensis]EOR95938.1 hypothetical protein ADIARSV_0888 [Arcticibacter svalbardensis MN12-7]